MEERVISGILTMLLMGMLMVPFNFVIAIVDETVVGSEIWEKPQVTKFYSLASFGPPSMQWNQTYGGAYGDVALSVVQTSDGGYALAGLTDSFGAGGGDFWLVKADAVGNIVWNQTYGGVGVDEAWSVVQTSDGGYAIAGYTYSFGAGIQDFWLVKTDSSGNEQWNQTYGGTNTDQAYSVVQTSDGGYAIAGYTYSFGAGITDFWLVKTDASGNHLWNKTYGYVGSGYDVPLSVVQTSDGGYAIAGRTESSGAGSSDFWLVKTDAAGNHLWNQTYGGTNYDQAWSVVQTSDGGYAIAGYTDSFGAGSWDFWLVKTDASGNHLWNQTYGGASDDQAWSAIQTSDGGYVLAGYTESFGAGGPDSWLVKTDASGNHLWNQTYGGTNTDDAPSVIQTSDGGYAIAGYTNSFGAGNWDFWLIKLAAEAPPPMFWKANFTDYAPSGMPDFDQRQDAWWPTWYPAFNWSWCAPVAVANSLWWYDSKYENSTIPPPTIIDNFLLVGNYGPWDDHDPKNVQPFIKHLAYLMDTDSQRTGLQDHFTTKVGDMETGLAQYLSWTGVNPKGDVNGDGAVDQIDVNIVNAAMGSNVSMPGWNMAADIWPVTTGWPNQNMADNIVDNNDLNLVTANMNKTGMFYEITVPMPDFYFIEKEVERSEDVVLLLGFYLEINGTYYEVEEVEIDGNFYNFPYGHAVTVAGINSTTTKIAISDPAIDAFEKGLTLGRSPLPHVHPGAPTEPPYTLHNNASLVSHDIYNITFNPNMSMWELVGYPAQGVHALIENAVITSLLEIHDVAITNLTLGKTVVGQNYTMKINVTMANEGTFAETFNVTTYYHYHNAPVFSEGFESGTFTGWDFYYSTNGVQSGGITPGTWSSSIVTGASALSGNYSARLFADAYAHAAPYRVVAVINRTINRAGALILRATLKFDGIQGVDGVGHSYFTIGVFNTLDTSKRVFYGFCTTGNYGDVKYTVSPGQLVDFERNIVTDYFNKYKESLPDQIMIRFYSSADYAEGISERRTTDVVIDDVFIVGPPVPIQTKTVTLTSGNSTAITFAWNTTGWAKGNYTLSASVPLLMYETDTADNSLVDGWIFVSIPGDVDGNRTVNIYDVVKITGIYRSERGDPQYKCNSDINSDGKIDIYDVVICTSHYGHSW